MFGVVAMRKTGLVILLFLLALALWLWPRSVDEPVDQSADPSAASATGEAAPHYSEETGLRDDPVTAAIGERQTNDQRISMASAPPLVELASDGPRAIWQALDQQSDVLEVLEEELMEGQLTVEAFEAEQELWAALCELLFYPDRQMTKTDIPLAFIERMEGPCQSVTPAVLQEITERWEAKLPRTQEELERYQQEDPLRQFMQAQDLDGARALLFDQMLEGLASQSLSTVMTSTWNLQQYQLLDLSPESEDAGEWIHRFDLIVPTAVALALTCSQIGGCADNHPLLMFLCSFPERGACRPPLDLYQAIDQMLTGAEITYFNRLLDHIERELRERTHATRP